MCISVLNKCQNYTYDEDGEYVIANDAVKEYLRRTLIQIKAAQDDIIADYAENCIADVTSCLNQNNYSASNVNLAVNACRASILTCMSVNGDATEEPKPGALKDWVQAVIGDGDDE